MDSSLNEHASGSGELKNSNVPEKKALSLNNPNSKRRRKNTSSSLCVTPMSFNVSGSKSLAKTEGKKISFCKNLACKDTLRVEDIFCKRCSCCICHKFDDNKDTSLWLTCNSDPPFDGESCGFSWHIDCAFKKSCKTEDRPSDDLDGCFNCVSCGKPNSLLECWKKLLMISKETESVEVLLCHLFMAHKLLKGTKKYKGVYEPIETAVKSLETEFGGCSLDSLPSAMRRGNVERLHSSTEVKSLCCAALIMLNDQSSSKTPRATKIIFENVSATSVTLVLCSGGSSSTERDIWHSIWHCKASEKDYPKDMTCVLLTPQTRFVVSKLTPATEYCFKVVSSRDSKELSVEEFKVFTQEEGERGAAAHNRLKEEVDMEKLERFELELRQCVKVLRDLECSGHIEKKFRLKFLSWFSFKATAREAKVVKGLINGFKDDDPIAFADQLIHSFSYLISTKRFAFGCGNGGTSG